MKPENSNLLEELYNSADQCSHEYPDTLARKIRILSQVQIVIGRKEADAVKEYKQIYATRQRVSAEAYVAAKSNKKQMAELAITDLRMKEAELESEVVRWNNAFKSNGELINALKYSLKVLLAEYNNPAIGRGG